jgi:hypothetical protein
MSNIIESYKEFKDQLFEGSLDDTTCKVITHYEYLQEFKEYVYGEDDAKVFYKVKSDIIKHKPDLKVSLCLFSSIKKHYIQVEKRQVLNIAVEIKIYFLPDEWFLVSIIKDFTAKSWKIYSYYKCDQIHGLIDLIDCVV